jgi:hypothetical protein
MLQRLLPEDGDLNPLSVPHGSNSLEDMKPSLCDPLSTLW